MSDIKCDKCGFSDNGTGDTAHVCSVVNKHNINLIAELQADNQRLRAIIEQDNVEPASKDWVMVPREPIKGMRYESGEWSMRNYDAYIEDQIAAAPTTPKGGE